MKTIKTISVVGIIAFMAIMIFTLITCEEPTPTPSDTVINISAIQGVTVPSKGGTPVTTITENAQYSGTVTWSPNHPTFAASTVYTATITLTPKTGYKLQGVAANFFTVEGATSVSNAANSGVITVVFPFTANAEGTRSITIDMYDSYGDGWDDNGALRINVNGVDIANNVRVQSGSTNTYTFNVTTGDVVQVYWVAGSYQSENSFIVYYTDTPPNPVFNQSSWNGINALVYKLKGTMDGISGGTLLGSFTVGNSGGNTDQIIDIATIQGINIPITGAVPVISIAENAQYSGTVTWSPNHSTFAAITQYTATITLTPKTGYTLQGITENFFTVEGAIPVSNAANSGIITAVFPKTDATAVTLNSVTANGSSTQTTTQLTLNFSSTIIGLSADDITLSDVTGVSKGTLSGSGTSYTLGISGFTSGGSLSVAVAKSGYNISGSPKSVTIYYYTPPTPVTLSSVTANGSVTETTTQLILTFDKSISGLSANDITLSGVSGVSKETLSTGPSSNICILSISGFTSGGTLTVTVAKSGYNISGSPKPVTIYYYTPPTQVTLSSVTANGSATETTTQLTLTFSTAITGLNANDITLSDVTGVSKGTLSGSGTIYTLGISGFTSGGTLSVAVASPSGYTMSGSPKSVTIYYYTPPTPVTLSSVTANGSATQTTTQLTLTFDRAISGLSTNDITLGGVSGVSKETLSIGPLSNIYILSISGFTSGGLLNVSVAKSGYNISSSPKEVTIYYAVPVSFNSVNANGSSIQTTTELILTFDKAISGLSASNISLSGVSVTKGTLSGSGTSYTLGISGFTSGGTLNVVISSPSGYTISGSPKTVTIYYASPVTLNSVSANGSSTQTTTELTLTFDKAITGLSATDITLSGVSGVKNGTLSGSNPYTLTVSGFTSSGTLSVAVSKAGYDISGSSKTATVYYYLTPVTINSITANGSLTQTTTQLTLTFDKAISGLSASDITLSGVSGVTKGTLSGSGSNYTLGISGFSSSGTLSVAVASPSGYTISGSPKTMSIYYATPVTFSSVSANGSSTQTTTQLTLTFDKAISGLSVTDITLSGVSGVNKGTLSGSGTSYTLGISGFSSGGTLSVAVASPSGYTISGSPKTMSIYYAIPVTISSVSANGSSTQTTTQLTLTFDKAISGLSASDITLSGVSGVTKGTLSGSGTSYTLDISGFSSSGTLSVAVASPSGYTISGSPKTVTIYYLIPVTFNSVIANGSLTQKTTQLTLTFDKTIIGLTADDITLSGVSGVSKGELSGSNPYVLPINGFISGGSLNVVVAKSGYTVSGSPKTVVIYLYYISGIEMVQIPGGSFQMGNNDSGNQSPAHKVTLSAFKMSKYEVTQKHWQDVMGKTMAEQQALASSVTTDYGRGNNNPVYYVSWYEAIVFCNRLSIMEGLTPAYRISGNTDPFTWGSIPISSDSTWNSVEIVTNSTGYRLPTEAQWNYAAKGGNGSPGNYTYSGSNTVGDVAWYVDNSGNKSHEVGKKAPNGLGLYDMSGNVYEWCWDWCDDYSSNAQTDPQGPSANSGYGRVSRGGSWRGTAESVGSDVRGGSDPYRGGFTDGFRLVRP